MSSIVKTVVGGAAGFLVGGPAGAMAGASLGASLGGSEDAADKQSEATKAAADTSYYATKYATDVQKKIYDQTRADQEPWRQAGVNALGSIRNNMARYNTPYGKAAPTPFQQQVTKPFSMKDFQADPGYNFRMSEGMKALDRSAAAKGGLFSGATIKGAERFGQDLASNEYQNAFSRYHQQKALEGQIGQNNYANANTAYVQDRNYYTGDIGNEFNRFSTIAGVGQTANNALQQAGTSYAGNVGNLTMTNAANQGNALLNNGDNQAAMYKGWGNAFGTAANAYGQYSQMQQQPNNASSYYKGSGAPGMTSNQYWY